MIQAGTFVVTAVSGSDPDWLYDGIMNTTTGKRLEFPGVSTSDPIAGYWRAQGFSIVPAAVGSEWPCFSDGAGQARVHIGELPTVADCSELA